MFIDRVKIHVKAGRGGNGCISFRREKHVPKGGPNGGDGGRGGNIIAQVRDHLNTLIRQYYTQNYRAEDGEHGKGNNRHGRDGNDVIVQVPPGTIVRDADTHELLADLTSPEQTVILAEGGLGGKGNARFKSSMNQAPRVAEKGEPGEERTLELELRLIADVGLVGYPNAGKSSILARVSAAKPKIAEYPFTTLSPVLGVVRVDDDRSFVLADIPGLIEGAHSGVGLGDEFLRHISRTRVLIHVIDAASVDGRDPVEDYQNINEELSLYDTRLAELPQIIAANKMDLPPAESGLQKLQQHLAEKEKNHRGTEARREKGQGDRGKRDGGISLVPLSPCLPIPRSPCLRGSLIPVSAATGEGLTQLVYSASQLLEDAIRSDSDSRYSITQQPATDTQHRVYSYEPGFMITKEGSKYILTGKTVRRTVLMTDLENEQAVMILHKKLKQMGVIRALTEAGAKDGDSVVVDDTEFTFMT